MTVETSEASASNDDRVALRHGFLGLVVGVLVGLGVGYLAWGTDPGATVPGRVGLSGQGDVTADQLVRQGLELHDAGDTVGAAEKYRAALALDPKNSVAMFNLGVIAHFDGDLEQARSWYEQAVAISPDFVSALYNLGLVLRDLGDPDGAITRLGRVIELQPDNPAALKNLGELLIDHGDAELGQELLDRAAQLGTDG